MASLSGEVSVEASWAAASSGLGGSSGGLQHILSVERPQSRLVPQIKVIRGGIVAELVAVVGGPNQVRRSDRARGYDVLVVLSAFDEVNLDSMGLRVPAASAVWPSAAVIAVAHSLLHHLLELRDAGWQVATPVLLEFERDGSLIDNASASAKKIKIQSIIELTFSQQITSTAIVPNGVSFCI